jgi:hypothetical protein
MWPRSLQWANQTPSEAIDMARLWQRVASVVLGVLTSAGSALAASRAGAISHYAPLGTRRAGISSVDADTPLYLQHAGGGLVGAERNADPLAHASHSSHASHASHVSHASHASGTTPQHYSAVTAPQHYSAVTAPPVSSNRAPRAENSYVTTAAGTPAPLTLRFSDADQDSLKYQIVRPPSHGTVTGTVSNALTYTPERGFYGSDSFTFKVNDGAADSNVATVYITVARVNHAPIALPQRAAVLKDLPKLLTLNAVDPDDDKLTYEVLRKPEHGTLSGTAPAVLYTPEPGHLGADSVWFRVSDGVEHSAAAVVSIVVREKNDAPSAPDQQVTVPPDVMSPIVLAATDPDGDELRYYIVDSPAHGKVDAKGGAVTYTPNRGFVGSDRFTYVANDTFVDSKLATVQITVASRSQTGQ